MNVYATVTMLKEYLGIIDGGYFAKVPQENLLRRFTVRASRSFDKYVSNGLLPQRVFYPQVATYAFDHPGEGRVHDGYDSRSLLGELVVHPESVLLVDRDLLEVDTLTTRNGGVTISSGDYTLGNVTGARGVPPYDRIILEPDGTTTVFEYLDTPYNANSVTGTWGYHNDWSNAWVDTGDTVQNSPLAAGGTTLTVSDSPEGADTLGLEPRFQVQGLLKIEEEYLYVTEISGTSVTVKRGVNGTTAAEHASGTPIYRYQPPEEIETAMLMLATHLFNRKDSVGRADDRPMVTAQGVMLVSSSMPREVRDMLDAYRKESL